ncbi:hypothetical protein Tco_0310783, partial [Tanacetum coccineum]
MEISKADQIALDDALVAPAVNAAEYHFGVLLH